MYTDHNVFKANILVPCNVVGYTQDENKQLVNGVKGALEKVFGGVELSESITRLDRIYEPRAVVSDCVCITVETSDPKKDNKQLLHVMGMVAKKCPSIRLTISDFYGEGYTCCA